MQTVVVTRLSAPRTPARPQIHDRKRPVNDYKTRHSGSGVASIARSTCGWLVLLLALAAALVALSPQPAGAVAPSPAPLVVIDPGHGGRYSNANANGLKEKHVNLAIARELRSALLARGYRVLMTRNSDRTLRLRDAPTWVYSARPRPGRFGGTTAPDSFGIPRDDLQARVDYANAKGADLFISIHANGSVNRSARGTETFASPRDYLGRRLAATVHREIVRATSLRDRGVGTADFYVCRWSNMPAILVESAFISNPSDAHLLKQPGYRRRIAQAIATGVDSWMASAPYRQRFPRVVASSSERLADQISRTDFPRGAATVVIARADRAAEVPGAAGLATRLGAPLLWTHPSGPSPSTATELARLAPQQLVLTGVDGSPKPHARMDHQSAQGDRRLRDHVGGLGALPHGLGTQQSRR